MNSNKRLNILHFPSTHATIKEKKHFLEWRVAMDIPALSTQLAVADAMTQYGTAVLAKTLETLEVQGDAVIKMMEKSVQPHLGQSIDIRL